jgi:hypothetical protein
LSKLTDAELQRVRET